MSLGPFGLGDLVLDFAFFAAVYWLVPIHNK